MAKRGMKDFAEKRALGDKSSPLWAGNGLRAATPAIERRDYLLRWLRLESRVPLDGAASGKWASEFGSNIVGS